MMAVLPGRAQKLDYAPLSSHVKTFEDQRLTHNSVLKVVYDLSQLPSDQLPSLRDSFIQSLTTFSSPTAPTGSRAIVTQLCLALSDLAFQMPDWKDVVPGMIESFGTRVECVEMLLEFLKCLVEEAGNGRIPITVS